MMHECIFPSINAVWNMEPLNGWLRVHRVERLIKNVVKDLRMQTSREIYSHMHLFAFCVDLLYYQALTCLCYSLIGICTCKLYM